MSVLVWDGTTLAADSYGNNGETCFPVTKLWRVTDENIAGAVGGVQAISALYDWVDSGCDPSGYPQEARLNKAQLLIAQKDTRLTRYHGSPIPIRLPVKTKLAIGEGSQYAYGALDMEATAEQAVAVAIKRSVHCNGEPVSITWSE